MHHKSIPKPNFQQSAEYSTNRSSHCSESNAGRLIKLSCNNSPSPRSSLPALSQQRAVSHFNSGPLSFERPERPSFILTLKALKMYLYYKGWLSIHLHQMRIDNKNFTVLQFLCTGRYPPTQNRMVRTPLLCIIPTLNNILLIASLSGKIWIEAAEIC